MVNHSSLSFQIIKFQDINQRACTTPEDEEEEEEVEEERTRDERIGDTLCLLCSSFVWIENVSI